jgi:hypothetical protein
VRQVASQTVDRAMIFRRIEIGVLEDNDRIWITVREFPKDRSRSIGLTIVADDDFEGEICLPIGNVVQAGANIYALIVCDDAH